VKKPVNCDVSEEDLAEAKRQFEEETHLQMKSKREFLRTFCF
jgi:hypothetical protein